MSRMYAMWMKEHLCLLNLGQTCMFIIAWAALTFASGHTETRPKQPYQRTITSSCHSLQKHKTNICVYQHFPSSATVIQTQTEDFLQRLWSHSAFTRDSNIIITSTIFYTSPGTENTGLYDLSFWKKSLLFRLFIWSKIQSKKLNIIGI